MSSENGSDRLISQGEEEEVLRLARSFQENAEEYQRMVDELRERAVEFVREHPEVTERLADQRHQFLGADLHPVDMVTEAGAQPLREGEVSVYDYERDVLLSVIVDLREGAIDRIEEHPGVQPPPTEEERADATEISREFLDRLEPEVSPLQVPIPEGDPGHGHRVVEVWYTAEGGDGPSVIVPVDLSQREVIEGLDHPWS